MENDLYENYFLRGNFIYILDVTNHQIMKSSRNSSKPKITKNSNICKATLYDYSIQVL